jgi:hypothetical protein
MKSASLLYALSAPRPKATRLRGGPRGPQGHGTEPGGRGDGAILKQVQDDLMMS